jgi:hypothetical protein
MGSWNPNAWEDGDRETTEVGTCVGCGSPLRVDPSKATPLPATGISSTIGTEPRATTEAGMGAGTDGSLWVAFSETTPVLV